MPKESKEPIFDFLFEKYGKDKVLSMIYDAAKRQRQEILTPTDIDTDEKVRDGYINQSSFEDVIQDAFKKLGIDKRKEKTEREREREEIEEMLDYCLECYPNSFIFSLNRFYRQNGYLSRRQKDVLIDIYSRDF